MKSYPSEYSNARDVEVPRLLEFLERVGGVNSLLDVGCSWAVYIRAVRCYCSIVDGVDLVPDDDLFLLLDHSFSGNFLNLDFDFYDFVSSISVVEHVGVKYKKVAFPLFTQQRFLKKMASLSKKYLYFSVPYGVPCIVPDEFMMYSRSRLGDTLFKIKGFNLRPKFFYNPNPPVGEGWSEISQSVADKVSYNSSLGVQCVCIVEGTKYGV